MPVTPAPAPPAAPAPQHLSAGALEALWAEGTAWLLGHWLQIVVATAAGALIAAAVMAAARIGGRLAARHPQAADGWAGMAGRVVSQTRGWFAVLLAAKLVDGYADPPPLVAATVATLFTVAAALQGALWARELVLGVVEHRAGGSHAALSSAIGIIRLLVTIVLFAVALVVILDNLGVNVTGLVAGLGIGGIAIGLAAKGIFDDLFSALSIIFDRPFGVGDSVRWDDTYGTVEAIGLKTTRVRSLAGEEVVVSNTNLLAKQLHNLTRLERRRITATLSLACYTPPELCARVPELCRAVVEAEDRCALVRCGMTGVGGSSLDFELQYDVHSALYDEVFSARHRIGIGLLRAFQRDGIDWAWPTQATLLADAEGRPTGVVPVSNVSEGEPPPAGTPPPRPPGPTAREIAPDS